MTTTDPPRIGAILLAGGASRGLGHPKQLVVYEGQTLIRRAVESLVASICEPVVVVLGAVVEECRTEIEDLPVVICVNDKWQVGISSGIKAGLLSLGEVDPEADAALIALCDQPFVTAGDYTALAEEFAATRSPTVASSYDDVIGVPAIFSRHMFDELHRLQGDEGARYLVRRNPDKTRTVEVSGAAFDVDTPEDEITLTNSSK